MLSDANSLAVCSVFLVSLNPLLCFMTCNWCSVGSLCPIFGGSDPGVRAEVVHSLKEELNLMCGLSCTRHPSAFTAISVSFPCLNISDWFFQDSSLAITKSLHGRLGGPSGMVKWAVLEWLSPWKHLLIALEGQLYPFSWTVVLSSDVLASALKLYIPLYILPSLMSVLRSHWSAAVLINLESLKRLWACSSFLSLQVSSSTWQISC